MTIHDEQAAQRRLEYHETSQALFAALSRAERMLPDDRCALAHQAAIHATIILGWPKSILDQLVISSTRANASRMANQLAAVDHSNRCCLIEGDGSSLAAIRELRRLQNLLTNPLDTPDQPAPPTT